MTEKLENEADLLNDVISKAKNFMEHPELKLLFDTFFKSGMPLVPFPAISGCLGIDPLDSSL